MKTFYTSLGLVAGASAAALVPRYSCCFGLTASGGVSGSVGQLSDGQNRIAQTGGLANQNGQYCINNGQITDGNGRGCILTSPTTQFQCDSGASPTGGFSVSNGNLAYNGNTQFYACPTGDNGGYNIYTQAVANQQGCVTVTLSTGGQCSGSGSGSSSAAGSASSAAAASSPAASAPASSAAQSSPAASAPASSAPVSSAPASSAPASSAPAASSPGAGASSVASSAASVVSSMASSAVASSPAASAPASGPATQTVWSTQYQTVTSCGPSVTNCPADSTVVYSSVVPMTSAPAGSAPASSAPAGSASASSAPASSAPAASAPASSAPASSAPTASAPASSAPAASAPASSAPASSAPASSAAQSSPAASAPASSAAQSSSAASGTAPSSASGSACQTVLTGAYQTPHAIIPVNQNSPDQSYGTQYNAYIGGGNSTIFNFDIPSSYSGKQCSVIFLFPQESQLETSSFTQSGSGGLTFEQLSSAAGLDVTYNSAPKGQTQLGQISSVTPGNSYVVSTGSCQAGTTESIEVSSTGGFSLEFFEDWNPSPIGVFITSC